MYTKVAKTAAHQRNGAETIQKNGASLKNDRSRGKFLAIAVCLTCAFGLLTTGCNSVQSVAITGSPIRKVYGQGHDFDPTGISAEEQRKKDTKTISASSSASGWSVSGYNKETPGEQKITVTYRAEGKSSFAPFIVTVVPVVRLSIESLPAKTAYKQGETFDPTGLRASAHFKDDAVLAETIELARLKLSEYNKDVPGKQSITAEYYGIRTTFDVTNAPLTSIAVVSPPNKTDYITGEDIDLEGLEVKGIWKNAGEEPINITLENLSGYAIHRAGAQKVTVTYSGKTTVFPVKYKALDALSVAREPSKIDYMVGEELDLDGIRVDGTYAGASSSVIIAPERLKISGFNKTKAGSQKVVLTLGGKSTSFTVNVRSPFMGTWRGQSANGTKTVEGKQVPIMMNVALKMTESTWILTISGETKVTELSGTYTPDSSTHTKLQSNDKNTVLDATIISGAMRLTGGAFGSGAVTLNK
jgi:hypothetical protein